MTDHCIKCGKELSAEQGAKLQEVGLNLSDKDHGIVHELWTCECGHVERIAFVSFLKAMEEQAASNWRTPVEGSMESWRSSVDVSVNIGRALQDIEDCLSNVREPNGLSDYLIHRRIRQARLSSQKLTKELSFLEFIAEPDQTEVKETSS